MNRFPFGAYALAVALSLAVGTSTAFAQAATGTVSGRVTIETSGDPVHAATVIIVAARRQTTTDSDGRFEIANVAPGTYEVIAQREQFSAKRQQITVTAGQTTTADFTLSLAARHETVTVTASATGVATTFDSFNAVTTINATELAKNRGATITDSLESQPGVAVRSFGAGSSRPIIRGFDGDRVLVMQDGVRTGDLSSQSADHGVSIDPASLDRLEVVKGPATLLYGSNAVGGVVNAITPQDAFRSAPFAGMFGAASIDAGTTNDQFGGNGSMQYGRGQWMVFGSGGARRTGDYSTPAGQVENSATALSSARGGVGWVGTHRFFNAGGQWESSRFGIPFAGSFHEHDSGDDESEVPDIDVKAGKRDVRIDAGLRSLQQAFLDSVKVTFNYTDYEHDEIETIAGVDEIGTQFSNKTSTVRGEIEHQRQGKMTGRLGVEWFGRDYDVVGDEALAPPTRQTAAAIFAYEELNFERYRLQFGGRVERTAYQPGARQAHVDTPGEEIHEPPPVHDRTFVGASGSVGVHASIGKDGAFVANLTGASRAPALEELYNFGPHVGNLAFEIGNPDLELERTIGIDLSLRSRAPRVQAEFNFFVYDISNFVFLEFTGDIEHGLREANYLQGDSRFIGFEGSGSFELGGESHLHASLSYVQAKLTEADQHLPRIPPLSGRVELEVPWRKFTFSPEVVFAADQGDVSPGETPTAGYGVLNIGGTYFLLSGHGTHAITVKGFNLTNAEYRRHTSFIKDLTPEIGRGVRVTYTLRFF